MTAPILVAAWVVKSVAMGDGQWIDSAKASREEVVAAAATTLPDPRQMIWHRDEYIGFVHFGVNTFTGVEWGTGTESPAIFNPQKMDTDQWCEAMVAAGMKKVILTAKHHDGFCLWPSRYTDQSVVRSPWKDGKGDVVKELAESCRKYGLTLGIYLSPADLFQIESPTGYYGNLSEYRDRVIPRPVDGRPFADKRTFKFKVDDYNEYFLNQLFELLTEYGPVHEVWFDGAKPKDKGGQQYSYQAWYTMIRELAPDAVIFGKGPDVRWCGNEGGGTRESEWNVVSVPGKMVDHTWPDLTDNDLGSIDALVAGLKGGGTLHYYPAETNTSIRHGWFWRDEEQFVKSADEIEDIWYRSAGGNTVFLLNIPPNRDGLFPERDVAVLKETGRRLSQTFAKNLVVGAKVTADSTAAGLRPEVVVDGSDRSYWQPDGGTGELTLTMPEARVFNRIVIQEDLAGHSQRIARFGVDVWENGGWQEVGTGTTVGYKRILRTRSVKSNRIRIRVLESRLKPTISEVGLYFAEARPAMPIISRSRDGNVTITAERGSDVHFSVDGADPDRNSPLFGRAVPLPLGGTVKAVGYDPLTKLLSEIRTMAFGMSTAKWTVAAVSSQESTDMAEKAFDGDPKTFWHSKYSDGGAAYPHTLAIDLGSTQTVTGFTYLPRQDGNANGTIRRYRFETSMDGKTWTTAVEQGEFGNIQNNPVNQTVNFGRDIPARFIRLTALEEVERRSWASIAELGVLVR